MTVSRGLQAFHRCWRYQRSAEIARPRIERRVPRAAPVQSTERPGSRAEASSPWLFASPKTVRRFRAFALSERSSAAAALSARARGCQGVKYLPGSVLPPNQWLERTAGQRRWPVPSALRAPAAAQPQRWAARSAAGLVGVSAPRARRWRSA